MSKLLISAFPKGKEPLTFEGDFAAAVALCYATGSTVIAGPRATREDVETDFTGEIFSPLPCRLWLVRDSSSSEIAITATALRAVAHMEAVKDLRPKGTKFFIRSIQGADKL